MKVQTVERPWDGLHVYLIEGRVFDSEETLLGEGFLGNWVEEGSSFLFFSRPADNEVSLLLRKRADLEFVDKYHFTYEQWQGTGDSPIEIGPFDIVAPWAEYDEGEKRKRILLDPGVVFGNGVHPTTKDCLRALCAAQGRRPFNKVIDLGTGTGVLALAAVYLGAEKVLALDINPLCVKTALKNVELNSLEGYINVFQGSVEDYLQEQADLLIANIHYGAMLQILKGKKARAGDRLILSGLMRSQWRDIRARLGRQNFMIHRQWDHDMIWFTALAEKT